jgi:hypothetical protein
MPAERRMNHARRVPPSPHPRSNSHHHLRCAGRDKLSLKEAVNRIRLSNYEFSAEFIDDEFDEFAIEPEVLLKLTNQD